MVTKKDIKSNRLAIWFSSIIRWILGLVFVGMAYVFRNDDSAWIVMLFGIVFIVTGFIRPKRCLENEDNCKV